MPSMPRLSDLIGLLQQQTEALASLPRTMYDLNRSILSLIDVVASARDTLAASQRVSSRIERIVDEMEEPVLALKPGLERLAVILDDPAVDTVPDTLRKINEEILPLVQGIQDTQTKVNKIATLAEETSTRLTGLPGASFLLGRRARNSGGDEGVAPSAAREPSPEAPAGTPAETSTETSSETPPQTAPEAPPQTAPETPPE